jgi:hypothetical protein
MHWTANDFTAEEGVVMGEDRGVGDAIEPRQRPVAFMRDAGRIDNHLVPEYCGMCRQSCKLFQRLVIRERIVPSDLDAARERLQLPPHLFLPEPFIRRIAVYDRYHLRVRRDAQKAFEKNEKAMGDGNYRIGPGELRIVDPPRLQGREEDGR